MYKKLVFDADEGFQAILLELIGKQKISTTDFSRLIKGLLLDAYNKSEGQPILFNRTGTFICVNAFSKT